MDRLRVLGDLVRMVLSGGRWWLAPVVAGLILVALLALASVATPLGPFIYPLF